MHKKTCWVANGLWGSAQDAFTRNGFQRQPSPLGAALMVMTDVASLSQGMDLTLRLVGGLATTPEVIRGEKHGPTRAYLPAIAVNREVWVTDNFCQENADMVRILVHIAHLDHSAWAILGSADEFELAKAEANRKKCNATVLAIATAAECNAVKMTQLAWFSRHVMPFNTFLKFVTRADTANWRDGL